MTGRKVFTDNSKPSESTTGLIYKINEITSIHKKEGGNPPWDRTKKQLINIIDEFEIITSSASVIFQESRTVINKKGEIKELFTSKYKFGEYLSHANSVKEDMQIDTLTGEGNLLVKFNNLNPAQHLYIFSEIYLRKTPIPELSENRAVDELLREINDLRNNLFWLFGFFHFVAPHVPDQINIMMMQSTLELVTATKDIIKIIRLKGPHVSKALDTKKKRNKKREKSLPEAEARIKEAHEYLIKNPPKSGYSMDDHQDWISNKVNEFISNKYKIKYSEKENKKRPYSQTYIIKVLKRLGLNPGSR